ncbi:ribosome hibernation-promoting factor, HPF/YfiA family [Maribacter sp. ACAM166]|uniref:ribosome hibernation-promoting factor, HPF/YfiA family n=1 Tax=Maribacter sp. ACAM166 TaxID=2508996 RepID=UPI0010FD14F8|nr:ribosome-associated translation inhibitor RaiA [Maribacter sp. ACAM166]TLP77250.1 ribosome-associated translation inhibitor RaiA [Maribacter sp. ACAM166]
MEIIYEYDGVTASKRLEGFVEEKLNKLHGKFDDIIRADVFLKEENTTSNETGKICNIRLSIPGPRIFSEASNQNFEDSVGESVRELERQLKKRKDKMKNF